MKKINIDITTDNTKEGSELTNKYVKVRRTFKNIIKDKVYFVKKIGYRNTDRQTFYLIKGRWVHCNHITKLTESEINAIFRKKKIKKLLDGK